MRKLFIPLLLYLMITSFLSYALESVIITLERLKPSIVTIKAEVAGMAKGPAQAFKDPKTGRIVVASKIRGAKFNREGAGAVLDSSGIIVTNAHVVDKAGRITVTLSDGTSVQASILSLVPGDDIAFLKISSSTPLTPVIMCDSNAVNLRQRVFNIGASEVIRGSFSEGKVTGVGQSAKNRDGRSDMIDLIQTSFNVYKGDSGGPLFDDEGKLMGLIVASHNTVGHTTYAIPANKILTYYLSIKK